MTEARFRPAEFGQPSGTSLSSHPTSRSNQPVHLAGTPGFNSYWVYSNGDYGGTGTKCFVEAVATSFWNLYAGFSVGSDPPILPGCCGVFQAQDGGPAWSAPNTGLIDQRVDTLAIDASGKVLYAGTDTGVSQLDFTLRSTVNPVSRSGHPRVLPPRK